jgi:hypothetical protein
VSSQAVVVILPPSQLQDFQKILRVHVNSVLKSITHSFGEEQITAVIKILSATAKQVKAS